MSTSSRVVRRRRVCGNGIPELATAPSAGLVTEYRAGEIARVKDPRDQKIALAQWSARAQQRVQAKRLPPPFCEAIWPNEKVG